MRRRVLNLVAALSLVVLVGTAALWVRSYWHVDVVGRRGRPTAGHWQRRGHAMSGVGSLSVEWSLGQVEPGPSRAPAGWGYESWPVRPGWTGRSWHGFAYDVESWDNSPVASDGRAMPVRMVYLHRVVVPHWFVLLSAATPVALWLRHSARRRRADSRLRQNLCPACGYDLRASAGRCPECGAEP